MNREQLIEMGYRITNLEVKDEAEYDNLQELFDNNVPHPLGSSLFFYPENYNSKVDDISEYNPTVEEVVDLALSYKPIILPYKNKEDEGTDKVS
jgi:hypothetical protein